MFNLGDKVSIRNRQLEDLYNSTAGLGWNRLMTSCLGKSGVVVDLDPIRRLARVKVYIETSTSVSYLWKFEDLIKKKKRVVMR